MDSSDASSGLRHKSRRTHKMVHAAQKPFPAEQRCLQTADTVDTRRTNSLALEKADCHVCAQKQRKCDRQRRRCWTCAAFNDTCRGYPVQLQWQEERNFPGRHRKSCRPIVHMTAQPAVRRASPSTNPRAFKFVGGKARKPRRPKAPLQRALQDQSHTITDMQQGFYRIMGSMSTQQHETPIEGHNSAAETITYDTTTHDLERQVWLAKVQEGLEPTDPIRWTTGDVPLCNPSQDLEDVFNAMLPPNNEFLELGKPGLSPQRWVDVRFDNISEDVEIQQYQNKDDNVQDEISSLHSLLIPEDHNIRQSFSDHTSEESSITQARPDKQSANPPSTLFLLTEHHTSNLLNMYDRIFCIYPVTGEMEANPFRCRKNTSFGSPYLLHAILAISTHHLGRQTGDSDVDAEVLGHKNTALQLYGNALQSPQLSSIGLTLLDTALILFALDATGSAYGDWNKKLKKVLELLQIFGGIKAVRHSSRVRAQVAMFLWWDTTISLLSRQDRVIPSHYFTALRENCEQDSWTFFDLVGCPTALVGCLIELSDLAAEYEKTRGMRWSKFDPTRVVEIQQFLRDWTDKRFLDLEDGDEAMEHEQDCYHCTEAWRNALLIYILRIFESADLPRSQNALSYRSRVTLDHVRCCRKTSNVQKQLLFPVFLAACETLSSEARACAKEYCMWWNEKSAYGMFSTAASLLETFWTRQLIEEDNNLWWGQVIDDMLCIGVDNSIQCLLG